MSLKTLCIAVAAALSLAGCATPHLASSPPDAVWQDEAFGYRSTLVTETRDTVFALDPDMLASLRPPGNAGQNTRQRVDQLVARLYDPQGLRLSYASGRTTGAADTWRNQSGDCLALTVMAYSAARALGLKAYMQEVQVPITFDRREGLDFIAGHVNLLVYHAYEVAVNGLMTPVDNFVVDFEPQTGANRIGQRLTEDGILARFYNNRAAQHLMANDLTLAYAYYRAAIAVQPGYAPAYANLAQVYARKNLLAGAEQLLLHAIALEGPSYSTLQALHQLLWAQGRMAEAQHYADLLARRQSENPYHWLSLGKASLQSGDYGAAVRALEQAARLATGFEEVHFQLALAYWRNGQQDAARQQLGVLSGLNHQAPGVGALAKKFGAPPAPAARGS
ncbi:MAG: hypothetical protein CFE44_02450 [Burkholderiales bacterium PBB4]|nr:MAG: hypothetical protein CFE44_02450 [Burkholderiales bacterium PBB4]